MKKVTTLLAMLFILLSMAPANAAEVTWMGSYFEFEYSVEPNGGGFLTTSPFAYQSASDTEDFFYDQVNGSSGTFSSVASGDLDMAASGWDVQMSAMARGPNGGVNPANGTMVQAFAQIDPNGLGSLQGVSIEQDVLSSISRRFTVDTDCDYQLSANFTGSVSFTTIGSETSTRHAVYTIIASVSIDRYTSNGAYVDRVRTVDLDPSEMQTFTVHLSPSYVYQLEVFLRLGTDLLNYTTVPSWAITGSLSGTYRLGTSGTPLRLSAFVTPVQIPPVADAGDDQQVLEGAEVSLHGSGTDQDGTIVSYNWTQTGGTPVSLSGASTQTATFTAPTYEPEDPLHQTGEALVFRLTVTDNDGDTDTDDVIINVSNVNQPPVANAGNDRSVNEGTAVSLSGSGTDPDGTIASYHWTQTGGPQVTLTGASSQTPSFTAPSVNKTEADLVFELEVTDNGGLKGTDAVTIHVANVNRYPVLDPIGNKGVDEGRSLIFLISASDPDDDDTISILASPLPSGASLTDYGNGTARFSWTPGFLADGDHDITFTARDNGSPQRSDSETITVTVNNVNRAPVLDPIGNQEVDEGALLEIIVIASDPDGDTLTLSASGLPDGSNFDAVTRTFSWTPGCGDSGEYTATFTVTDDGDPVESDSETITITVNDANCAPVLNTIGAKTVNEGDLLQFTVAASDYDHDALTYSASGLPGGSNFNAATRTFSWMPGCGDAGEHTATFTVTDDGVPLKSDSETITITVNDSNCAPVLNSIGDKTAYENALLQFTVAGSDYDNDALTFSASGLPDGSNFNAATRTFSWMPGCGDAGEHTATFTVTDDGDPIKSDLETITITVNDVNCAPVLDSIGEKPAYEGELLQFTVTASDPDDDALTFTASNLPQGASFNSVTHTFTWTPDFDDTGNYDVVFTVTDDGTPHESDSEKITISVGDVNQAPYFDPQLQNMEVDEEELLELTVRVTDPDGDDVTITADYSSIPSGVSFIDNGDGTATFTWTPGFEDTGNYPVEFTATDNGTPPESYSREITISVGDVNRPPVIKFIGYPSVPEELSVSEGQILQVSVSGTDPDIGDTLAYTASNLPDGAMFNADTQTFTWTPDYDQAGTYEGVVFTVTDDGTPPESRSEPITITVYDVNRAPELDIGNKTVNENEPLEIQVTATDPDGDSLTYSVGDLPSGADFDEETHKFSWKPTYEDAGDYSVMFTATDIKTDDSSPLSDSETITITVVDRNRPPVLNSIGSQWINEGQHLQVMVTAGDPDGDRLIYTAGDLPPGASFDDITHIFSWTPAYGDADDYFVLITVTDDGTPALSDSEQITITVKKPVSYPPDPPNLANPLDGSHGGSLSATTLETTGKFEFTDLDGDSHARTRWQISETSDFSSLVLDITTDTNLYSLNVPEFVLDEDSIYYWRVRFVDNRNTNSNWSESWSFETEESLVIDDNKNGIPDDQEVNASVDLNGDGIPDVDQPDVIKCVNTIDGSVQIGILGVQNVDSILSLKAIDPDTIDDKPDEALLGLVSFKLKLADPNDPIAKVEVLLSVPAADDVWYKYDSINGWQDYSSHAEFNPDRTRVTLTFTDGGFGDADGTANARIVDPSGPTASSVTVFGGGGGGGCFIGTAVK
jgi:hypothetical protein